MSGSVHPDRNNVPVARVKVGRDASSTLAGRIDQEGDGGKRND
jgi:hypothetical protein